MSHDTLTADPLAVLEQAAQRQRTEETAAKLLDRAAVRLVLGKDPASAFFTALALRLPLQPDWEIDTACTDGRRVQYSPAFIARLSPTDAVGVLAHEALHCGLAHFARQGEREASRFNAAADLEINPILLQAGLTLPACRLMPGEGPYRDLPSGLSAEEYYDLLPPDPPQNGQGEGPPDPGGCGGVTPQADPAAEQQAKAEWQVTIAQAAHAAKQRGQLPAGLARLVDSILTPTVDWRDVLREFLSRALTAREDYSWSNPNRRFIAQGLYLPSLRSEALGEIVLAVDTSGSIDAATLASFAAECNGILECSPCRVTVLYCDAHIQRVQEWEPSDGPLALDAVGGGGTDHRPVTEWICQSGIDPAAVVMLTDGETTYPDAPSYPVLWALTPGSTARPPFGHVLTLKGGAR